MYVSRTPNRLVYVKISPKKGILHKHMSANDLYRVFKKDGKFLVYHTDMDECYDNKKGEFDTLKEACAFIRKEEDEGFCPAEYGTDIAENCFD